MKRIRAPETSKTSTNWVAIKHNAKQFGRRGQVSLATSTTRVALFFLQDTMTMTTMRIERTDYRVVRQLIWIPGQHVTRRCPSTDELANEWARASICRRAAVVHTTNASSFPRSDELTSRMGDDVATKQRRRAGEKKQAETSVVFYKNVCVCRRVLGRFLARRVV